MSWIMKTFDSGGNYYQNAITGECRSEIPKKFSIVSEIGDEWSHDFSMERRLSNIQEKKNSENMNEEDLIQSKEESLYNPELAIEEEEWTSEAIRKAVGMTVYSLVQTTIKVRAVVKEKTKCIKALHGTISNQQREDILEDALIVVPKEMPALVDDALLSRKIKRMEGYRYRHLKLRHHQVKANSERIKNELQLAHEMEMKARFEDLPENATAKDWKQEEEKMALEQRVKRRDEMMRKKEKRKIQQAYLKTQATLTVTITSRMIEKMIGGVEDKKLRKYMMESKSALTNRNAQNDDREKKLEQQIFNAYRMMAEKVFVIVDWERNGRIPVDRMLHALKTHPANKYVAECPPLQNLLTDAELQSDLVVMDMNQDGHITIEELVMFIEVLTRVESSVDRVKQAVERINNDEYDEENQKWEQRLVILRKEYNVKKSETSKKISMRQSMLTAGINLRRIGFTGTPLKNRRPIHPVWKMHHYHRIIRILPGRPLYCCICRRRKFELLKLERDELEEKYRIQWQMDFDKVMRSKETVAIKTVKAEIQERKAKRNVERRQALNKIDPTDILNLNAQYSRTKLPSKSLLQKFKSMSKFSFRKTNKNNAPEVVGSPVKATNELTPIRSTSISKTRRRSAAGRRSTVINATKLESKVLKRIIKEMTTVEQEELERTLMYDEDEYTRMFLEQMKREIERPWKVEQEIGHRNYLQLVSDCKRAAPVLARLRWERTLTFGQFQMVAQVVDRAKSTRHVLQTVACDDIESASAIYKKAMMLRKVRNPAIVSVNYVYLHTIQRFASSGALVDYVPLVFGVMEYCPRGTLVDHIVTNKVTLNQQTICQIIKQCARGLKALHVRDIQHWNLKPTNLFIADNDKIKIGSFLMFKDPRTALQLCSVTSYGISTTICPPEVYLEQKPPTAKADVWAIGCLIVYLATGSCFDLYDSTVKSTLTKLNSSYTDVTRSLIRMAMQHNAELRSDVSGLISYLDVMGNFD